MLCFDEDCGGAAEDDGDGDYTWWVCTECGSEFGYVPVEEDEKDAGPMACPSGQVILVPDQSQGVPVTLGRKK